MNYSSKNCHFMKLAWVLTFNYLTYPVYFAFLFIYYCSRWGLRVPALILLTYLLYSTKTQAGSLDPHYPFFSCISALQCLCCSEQCRCYGTNYLLLSEWFLEDELFGSQSQIQNCVSWGHTHKQSLNLLSSSIIEQNSAMLKNRIWNCYQHYGKAKSCFLNGQKRLVLKFQIPN